MKTFRDGTRKERSLSAMSESYADYYAMRRQSAAPTPAPVSRKIWDGTRSGYAAIEGDQDVLFGQQRIYRTPREAETEFVAVAARRETGMPNCRPIAAYCQHAGCSNVVFIWGADDFNKYRDGRLYCSACQEYEFNKLSPEQKEEQQKKALSFLKNLNNTKIQ